MNTNQINRYLNSNKRTKQFFHGTYALDILPKCKSFPCALVVNMDRSEDPGSHWCSIWANSPAKAFYFDSYGEEPPPLLRSYLLKNFKIVKYNTVSFQSLASSTCAYYCIAFIYLMSVGMHFDSFLNILGRQSNPDYFVHNFVLNEMFK
jgi:hypothetical protein